MIIRNCQIITSDGSHMEMSVAENRHDFTGNTITRVDNLPRAFVYLDDYGQVNGAFDCGDDLIAAVGSEEAKNYNEFYLIKVEP